MQFTFDLGVAIAGILAIVGLGVTFRLDKTKERDSRRDQETAQRLAECYEAIADASNRRLVDPDQAKRLERALAVLPLYAGEKVLGSYKKIKDHHQDPSQNGMDLTGLLGEIAEEYRSLTGQKLASLAKHVFIYRHLG